MPARTVAEYRAWADRFAWGQQQIRQQNPTAQRVSAARSARVALHEAAVREGFDPTQLLYWVSYVYFETAAGVRNAHGHGVYATAHGDLWTALNAGPLDFTPEATERARLDFDWRMDWPVYSSMGELPRIWDRVDQERRSRFTEREIQEELCEEIIRIAHSSCFCRHCKKAYVPGALALAVAWRWDWCGEHCRAEGERYVTCVQCDGEDKKCPHCYGRGRELCRECEEVPALREYERTNGDLTYYLCAECAEREARGDF